MKLRIMVVSLLCVLGAGGAWAVQSVDEIHSVPEGATVTVENIAGKITVHGWSEQQLKITGTLGDDVEELEVSIGRDRVHVEVEVPQRSWHRGKL